MTSRVLLSAALLLVCTAKVGADEGEPSKASAEKYTLRYQFHPGETLRWNVAHRCQIRTTVSGTTQTAETLTNSVKAWRVREVRPDGTAVFEHLVEAVDMRHKLSGRDEVHYDSRKDLHAPAGFEHVAQAVQVPLSIITMDARGKVVQRKRNPVKGSTAAEGEMTIPMPEEAVAVGHQWSFPHDIEVSLPAGGIHRVKSQQTFTLLSVKTGVASIQVATQILTPVQDPALESLLLQYGSSGTVRFDIDAGRVLGQQMDVDKGVVGFRGEASSIRYTSRFTEEFAPSENKLAARTVGRN
jgi:hypothetical protein